MANQASELIYNIVSFGYLSIRLPYALRMS